MDETLRRQINERLDYEKKALKIFIYNQSGKYVYVVENMEYESCGFFVDYDRALKYAKKAAELEPDNLDAAAMVIELSCTSSEKLSESIG